MKLVKHPAAASRERAAAEERLKHLRGQHSGTDSPFQAPLIFDHFRLEEDGLDVEGTPTLSQYSNAGEFIAHAEHGGPFWLADWLNYGDTRPEWAKQLDQVQHLKRHKAETIEQYKRVARKVPKERRRPELTYGHHKIVESCAPEEQTELLGKAVDEAWTPAELRREMHAKQKRGVLRGQAPLEGKFRVVYADPPWLYSDRPPSGIGAQSHYPGMTVDQLCALQIKAHTLKDAVLFMWVTAPKLYDASDGITPDPYRIIRAWGFQPKTGGVWDKVLSAGGHYFAVKHEHLIIATRGSCTPDRPTPQPDSVQTIRRSDTHSEKPEEYAQMIEKLYDGPYVELFARKPREGWTTWGNQVLAEVRSA